MRSVSRLSLAVAVVLSLIATGLTWSVYRAEIARQQAALDNLAQRAARRVEVRVEQHIALLTATQAFLEAHRQSRERDVFAAFVAGLALDGRYAGLQGIGLAQLLAPGTEAAVAARLARDYGMPARVWPDPVPGLRTAITLLEPSDARNRAALGFDMATEDRRRTAMLQARARDEPAATAPVQLVQEITQDVQAGILIYTPLRNAPDPSARGFVYAPLRMGDLFTTALSGGDLPVEIRAIDVALPVLPLFESPGYAAAAAAPESAASLRIAGRDWTLLAKAAPGFDQAGPWRRTLLSGIGFALLALTATYAVHWQGLAIHRARALGEMARRNAEQKDLLMHETVHRLKNVLARVSGIARLTAREAVDKADMAARLDARLQAMASAQDLLVRSGTDSVDLERLLRSEVEQVAGTAMTLSGPPVQVTAQQVQALALVFHELATNAVKYGAAAQDRGRLDVSWTIERTPAGEELALRWQESIPVAAPPPAGTGSGFGTRLLGGLIEGELGGTLERRLDSNQLTVAFRFPLNPAATAVAA